MRITPVGKLLILIIVLGGAIGGWRLWKGSAPTTPPAGGSSTNTTDGSGRVDSGSEGGTAGVDLGASGGSGGGAVAPTVGAGDVLMYYERSTETWLKQAADDFNRTGNGRIVLDYRGSREGKQEILYGKSKPVLWNPADTYWTDKLNLDWRNPQVGKHSEDVIRDAKPILASRLVLVTWDDRARVLSAAMQQSRYRGKTWTLLHDIATRGWSAVGGSGAWGKLKLLQSDPIQSNSGQAALALMLAEYRQSHPGAGPEDAGFVTFMTDIERCVRQFPDTTSKVVEAFVNGGTGETDIAIAYETNALAAVDRGASNLRVLYPDPTVAIEFPAAIIRAPWVSTAQAQRAQAFVDYLLQRDIQQRAVQYGLRPVDPDLRGAVDNAFASGNRGTAGFRLDVTTVVRPVSTTVVDSLLYLWNQRFGGHRG